MTKQVVERKILISKKIMEQIKSGNYSGGFTDRDYSLIQEEIFTLIDIYETALDGNDLISVDTMFKEIYNGQFTFKALDVMCKINKGSFAYLFVVNNETIKFNNMQFYNCDNNDISPITRITIYEEGRVANGIKISCEKAVRIAEKTIIEIGIMDMELRGLIQ